MQEEIVKAAIFCRDNEDCFGCPMENCGSCMIKFRNAILEHINKKEYSKEWVEFLTYGSIPQMVHISSVQRISKSAEYTTMLYMDNGNVLEVNESYEDVLRKLRVDKG